MKAMFTVELTKSGMPDRISARASALMEKSSHTPETMSLVNGTNRFDLVALGIVAHGAEKVLSPLDHGHRSFFRHFHSGVFIVWTLCTATTLETSPLRHRHLQKDIIRADVSRTQRFSHTIFRFKIQAGGSTLFVDQL